MTRKEFLQLPDHDRKLFISKLITAIHENDECFAHADYIITMSEKDGKFKVKYGSDVYRDTVIKD